jgi:hypothetical protein
MVLLAQNRISRQSSVRINGRDASDEELAAANLALEDCPVSPGTVLRSDNKHIDGDLARE